MRTGREPAALRPRVVLLEGADVDDQAAINADDADLDVGDDVSGPPSWWKRTLAALLSPLGPLANLAARYRLEVASARFVTELTRERRKRRAAELKAEAAEQKAETIAKMHAHVIAMLDSEIAIHAAAVKRVTER